MSSGTAVESMIKLPFGSCSIAGSLSFFLVRQINPFPMNSYLYTRPCSDWNHLP
jgi:hypothetical protein